MNGKRISGIIIGVIGILAIGGVVLVRSWMTTPHGKLDPRVAVYLKLTNAAEKNRQQLAAPVEESRRMLAEKAASVAGDPVPMASVRDMKASAGGLTVPVRVYTPEGEGPFPAVLFYHGGGWVQGSVDTHDSLCRVIAKKSGAVVVSVEYRLAPEHTYPAAVNDAYAALLWVAKNGPSINVDPDKLAVAGDSAGGNLAAAVSLMARDREGPDIDSQVLIYPGLDAVHLDRESYRNFGRGYMLDKAAVKRFISLYLPDEKDRRERYASPLLADSHKDLPPALVITAGFDVLRDEGEAYVEKLEKDGVDARLVRYDGMVHGFISADKLLPQAREATDIIAEELKIVFGQ
jgi:acetyl esterase